LEKNVHNLLASNVLLVFGNLPYLTSNFRSKDIKREIATRKPLKTMYYYNTKNKSKYEKDVGYYFEGALKLTFFVDPCNRHEASLEIWSK
jgi:hypothetical protein